MQVILYYTTVMRMMKAITTLVCTAVLKYAILTMRTTICTLTAISTRKMQRRQARKNGFTLYFGYSSAYLVNGVGFTQDAMEI